MGVLCLLQEYDIDLDNSIAPYLRRWTIPQIEYNAEDITFRDLLGHTGGLNVYGFDGFESEGPLPDIIAQLEGKTESNSALRIVSQPGEYRRYSGGGYLLLQLLMEDISGMDFREFMKVKVFDPLKMTCSGYTPNEMSNVSGEYNYRGSLIPSNSYQAWSAAGLYTCGADLTKFLSLMIHTKTDSLWSPIIADAIMPLNQNPNYGLSFTLEEIDEIKFVGHGGNNTGWNAQIYWAPEVEKAMYFIGNASSSAQLEIDLSCVWKSWVAKQSLESVCRESIGLIKNLKTANTVWAKSAIKPGGYRESTVEL